MPKTVGSERSIARVMLLGTNAGTGRRGTVECWTSYGAIVRLDPAPDSSEKDVRYILRCDLIELTPDA